jgi:hypothetical protein
MSDFTGPLIVAICGNQTANSALGRFDASAGTPRLQSLRERLGALRKPASFWSTIGKKCFQFARASRPASLGEPDPMASAFR